MATVVERPVVVEPTGYNPLVRLVYFLTALIDALLILRLIFRVLGANAANGFVHGIYNLTAPLVAPFFGIFNSSITATLSQAHLEVPTIVAIVVYTIVGSLLAWLFGAITPRTRAI